MRLRGDFQRFNGRRFADGLIVFLAVLAVLVPGHANPQGAVGTEPLSRKPLYTPFLAWGAKPDFKLDAKAFKHALKSIQTSYVNEVSEARLLEGARREVAALARQARLPTSPLLAMPLSEGLPQRVVHAYGKAVTPNLLWYAMVRGLVASLKDPDCAYFSPKAARRLAEPTALGGAGMTVAASGGALRVLQVFPGGPAIEAGIAPGDKILKINGTSTRGLSRELAATLIRGPLHTPLRLLIRRGEDEDEVRMMRRALTVKPLVSRMLDGRIAYVDVRVLAPETTAAARAALADLHARGAQALIVDLRDVRDGSVNAAADFCGLLTPPGTLVVEALTRGDAPRRIQTAAPVPPAPPRRPIWVRPGTALPPEDASPSAPPTPAPQVEVKGEKVWPRVYVLVNRYSGDAAEIAAACLRDSKTGEIVGEHTAGRGRYDTFVRLADGSVLRLPVGRWRTPRGDAIDKKGIAPDVRVPDERTDPRIDAVLERAVHLCWRGASPSP